MTGLKLIGQVAAGVVRSTLDEGRGTAGTARFLVQGLSKDEVLAIVAAIDADRALADRLEVGLPRYGFADAPGLDPRYLTDRTTTELRHMECEREGRLMVLLDDSQSQSLAQVDRLDGDALLNEDLAPLWLDRALSDVALDEAERAHLLAAFRALLRIDRVSVQRTADYLVAAALEMAAGSPVTRALGRSLTVLRLPRFDALFDEIPPAKRTQPSQWQQRFNAHWRRECFVAKRDASQIPFSNARLREKLEALTEQLTLEAQAALRSYVEAPFEARDALFAPFELDWPEIRLFFEEAQRTDARSLGQDTRRFYSLEDPALLTAEEHHYLEELAGRGRNPSKNERDEEFFNSHAAELRQDPRLIALWDRFIFGAEVPCTDLVDGLIQCVRRLYHPALAGRQTLLVEGRERTKSAFLGLNDDVCRFFATRYRGLEAALHGLVAFRHVEAFRYPEFAEEIAEFARRTPDATGKRARQLHFTVSLVSDDQTTSSVRLVWECGLEGVGIGLESDLRRLLSNRAKTPLVRCSAGQRRVRTRGGEGGISLADLSGLEPASNRDRGSFVPASSRCESLAKEWQAAVDACERDGLIDTPTAQALGGAFAAFEAAYAQALQDFIELGPRAPSLEDQNLRFGELLVSIVDQVRGPVALDRLLRPLFEIAVARADGGGVRPVVIVCPWHPLRLAAQHARLTKLRAALEEVLTRAPRFTDGGALFFSELSRSLAHPGRPDVAVSWLGSKPGIMALTDALYDYSLHEPPMATPGMRSRTNENAAPIAKQVAELVASYLHLQPHEKDNLSIVLFNCDAAALPQAVVDAIRAEAERDGGEAMCQVVLRHTSADQLRDLYQQLVARELEADNLHASEATRDFMSRLRISIMVNQQAPSGRDGPPHDIVFCHDVISRQAMFDWVDVPRLTRPAAEIDPDQWSRRRPIGRADRDAVVYLTCPAQTGEGWAYLDAAAALADPALASAARAGGQCRVPVRKTDVLSDLSRQVLEETHRLGNWVVNFDDLLDRRQLMNRRIDVIKYRHAPVGGRSLIISSKASDSLLRATLRGRLRALELGYDASVLDNLAGRLIADANHISGDIVLRAARRGTNASELIGVVLSRFLIEHELGEGRPAAWIFLDDYASWLGQDEKRIADLLCLSPTIVDGQPVLNVIVTEAKYVTAAGYSAKAEHSAKQLRDTLVRLESALLADEAPADRGIWRGRLSDMLLDGLRDDLSDGIDWRTALRDGQVAMRLRGYSHVFIHGHADGASDPGDAVTGVVGTATGQQERFGVETVRSIMRAYADRSDPSGLRGHDAPPPPKPGGTPAPAVTPGEPPMPTTPAAEAAGATASPPASDPAAETAPASQFEAELATQVSSAPAAASDEDWLAEVAQRCRSALLRYGMSAKLEQQTLTPNAALLKFKGSDELTIAKVEAKVKELQTTHGLEVLTVRGEPGRVVLSIRRPRRQVLRLGDVWQGWAVRGNEANARLLIAVKEDDGGPLYLEPEPAPHTLVAGSTGSGKSVLIQNMLLGIAATNTPAQAQIVLIDPKSGVDYFPFEGLPHLDGGIIDTQDEALARLDALVAEMERRYSLFKEARVSNIRSYNRKVGTPLPLIWLVHDEFADWMQVDEYRAGVEAAVSRLGVKARAAGIYLIFAAQRPDNSVFPMQLRANLGNRLILRVDSAGTSDLSLGLKGGGAERLLGKGHLAAILGGGSEPVYAQVPFIGEDELERLVEAIVADLS